MWLCSCIERLCSRLNVLLQQWQRKVFSSVWLLWLFSSVCSSHVNCQLASWVAWKVTPWLFVGLFPRVGHLVLCKGVFSIWCEVALVTEWVIQCRLIWSNWSEEYLHWLHWWGFSPVCVMICFFRSLSASWYVSLDHYLECMSICIVHTWAASPQNGWACAFSML